MSRTATRSSSISGWSRWKPTRRSSKCLRPWAGRIERVFGQPHDVVRVGAPLVGFEGEEGADAGTVVGHMPVGGGMIEAGAPGAGHATSGVKATPAVRALAHRLEVDLALVTPSGPDGVVTAQDVQRVAKLLEEWGPPEPLRGVRRAMARNMALAQREVPAATVMDDADIHAWPSDTDTIRSGRSVRSSPAAGPRPNSMRCTTARPLRGG